MNFPVATISVLRNFGPEVFPLGFLKSEIFIGVIDRKTWAIEDLEFSECVLRMISRGVSNQTQGIGVHPGLVLAAGQPSARDLASPRTGSAAYDPEIRTLANCRS